MRPTRRQILALGNGVERVSRASFAELRPALNLALVRMRELSELSRPFVIVEHEASGKIVQFCGGLGVALLFDVPCCRLTLQFQDFVSEPIGMDRRPWLCNADVLPPHLSPALDVLTHAVAALRAHGVPEDAELTITEHHEHLS